MTPQLEFPDFTNRNMNTARFILTLKEKKKKDCLKFQLNWMSCILSGNLTPKSLISNLEHNYPQFKVQVSNYTVWSSTQLSPK